LQYCTAGALKWGLRSASMGRPHASLTGILTEASQGKVAFRKFRQAFMAGSDPETACLYLG
jgi:hypothetical protein